MSFTSELISFYSCFLPPALIGGLPGGFPGGSVALPIQESWVQSLGWKNSLEKCGAAELFDVL